MSMSPHGRSLSVDPEALQAAARETLRLCRLSKAAHAASEPQAPAPRGSLRLRLGKAGSAAPAGLGTMFGLSSEITHPVLA